MSDNNTTSNKLAAIASPPAEWPTDPKLYDFIGKIGQGAFATVWRAEIKHPTNVEIAGSSESDEPVRECAVKVLNLDHVDTNLSEIRMEVQSMRLSSHPNVLTCYTAFVHDINLWLVTPLMTKGSSLHCLQTARRVLRRQQQTTKTHMEEHILYIIHETLLGLKYIHENGQIHRDIKAGNILLDGNGDVRIADFGVSGWLVQAGSQQEKARTFVGTPCWMAPEVMEQVHGYDTKADIWSLGITALELAKGYAPYAKYPPMKVLILTIQEDPPSLRSYDDDVYDDDDYDNDNALVHEDYSRQFQQLTDLLLQKNPARRPCCADLLQGNKLLSCMSLTENTIRQARRDAIRDEVCQLVRDVGSRDHHHHHSAGAARAAAAAAIGPHGAVSSRQPHPRMPGMSPVSIVLSSDQHKDRPAGTTWVFADGSSVVSSSQVVSPTSSSSTPSAAAAPASAHAETIDDAMAELDEFGKQTGGEHYQSRHHLQQHQQQQLHEQRQEKEHHHHQQQRLAPAASLDDDDDDLDKFMDEFEQATAGEDFGRQS